MKESCRQFKIKSPTCNNTSSPHQKGYLRELRVESGKFKLKKLNEQDDEDEDEEGIDDENKMKRTFPSAEAKEVEVIARKISRRSPLCCEGGEKPLNLFHRHAASWLSRRSG
ncbi:uncharacterized protein LOC121751561 isoform X2 [Salvia splendens]|uniref:uncharacterized protein LOC121751561 isoform X2 n=1 Tax=Salvia splendens TaxID=180675 RepID=UPI001C26CB08|nr:uncharacterized protein LOC121751561 isoform X2 [Salvia splendens]